MNSDVKAKIQLLATFVIFFDIFDLESNNHKRVHGGIYTVLLYLKLIKLCNIYIYRVIYQASSPYFYTLINHFN